MPGTTRGGGAGRPAAPPFLPGEVEDEVELRPAGPRLELHHTARVPVSPGSTRDGEGRVPRGEERAFDRDVAVLEEGRPVALVRARRLDANAVALIPTHPLRIGGAADRVVEGEDGAG